MPTYQELADWYDARYALGPDVMRPYDAYPWQVDFLNPEPGKMLLDVCCGSGYFLLAARRRNLHVWGVDVSPVAVEQARKTIPWAVVKVAPAERLPFAPGLFDYVTCLGSLEHVVDPDAALEEMKRVARPDARFYISVPNRDFIYWRLGGRRAREQEAINENPRSLREWRELFDRHGLKVVKLGQDRWSANKVRPRWLRPAARIVWRFLPLRWAYTFTFVLRAK